LTLTSAGGWNVIVRDDATTISPDPEGAIVFTFDLEGRPIAWSEGGTLYKRSLASEIHARRQSGPGAVRSRWVVPPDDAPALLRRLLEKVAEAPAAALDDEGLRRLAGIRRWTPDRLLAEKTRFAAAYRPPGILPPDQYLAIVLQATFGCSWNRCTFCSFYANRPFSVRSPEDFAAHARAVRELLGRGAALRRRIFLADGDALVLSNARLLPLMSEARAQFPGRPFGGFVDVFAGAGKSAGDWEALRDAGLERVQVGLETGDGALLRWLDKPGTRNEVEHLVGSLKRSGLAVSVIVMEGLGGDRFARAHVEETIELLGALPLDRGDVVYLSPFLENPESEYARRAARDGIGPLTSAECEAQGAAFRDAVRRAHPGVKVARYDVREFIY
jgi:hypothetical protein